MTDTRFTSQDYRRAAAIARQSGGLVLPAAAEAWDRKAEKVEAQEKYAFELGKVASEQYNYGPGAVGMLLLARLLKDGWTAPEGLFDA